MKFIFFTKIALYSTQDLKTIYKIKKSETHSFLNYIKRYPKSKFKVILKIRLIMY